MLKTIFRAAVLLAITSGTIQAQDDDNSLSLDGGTLDSQVEYLIEESNNYQQYDVVPQGWLKKFRGNLNDSLVDFRNEASELEKKLETERKTITDLRAQLAATQDTLGATRQAQNEMDFVGIPMAKSNYRATMWSIIGVLVLALVIFIVRFRHSNATTKDVKEKLATIEDEFDQHRKRSLEREQKLRRELQDELNKQRNS